MSEENSVEDMEGVVEELPVVNEEEKKEMMAKLEMEQNLPLAIVGGAVAAIIGAAIWATVTVVTEYQIGWMAIGVGFLVGYAVRFLGKGISPIFGIVGATFALLGCVLGNIFSMVYFGSVQEGVPFFELLSSVPISALFSMMVETFALMDLLFYGLAIYEGFKLSFRV
ncbi:MAG: hypothetical protein ABUK01_09385 [Leptospirales bacterium]